MSKPGSELTPTRDICMSCEFNDCSECEQWTHDRERGCCCGELQMAEWEIAEERLRARDYESWADL